MNLSHGGHLTHGSPVNFSGNLYNVKQYGINSQGFIDYDEAEQLAIKWKPKLIIAGASAYPREIDFKRFRQISDLVDAYFMVDMAQIAGLVATGLHLNPIPYADVVTTTTQKTLRGPRGGLILAIEKYAKKLNSAIFPGIQGGPLEHVIAGKAVCFFEALQPEFKQYQEQVLRNAKTLAHALIKKGIPMISCGTDNHMMLLDLRTIQMTGKEAEDILYNANITVNKNMIPNDSQFPQITSGIRIGTPAMTTRGMKEPEMELIAEYIYAVLIHKNDLQYVEMMKQKAIALCNLFPLTCI